MPNDDSEKKLLDDKIKQLAVLVQQRAGFFDNFWPNLVGFGMLAWFLALPFRWILINVADFLENKQWQGLAMLAGSALFVWACSLGNWKGL